MKSAAPRVYIKQKYYWPYTYTKMRNLSVSEPRKREREREKERNIFEGSSKCEKNKNRYQKC